MHSLLILVLILDALIAISSVLNLVNMVRVNLLVEEKQAQALTVQLVRVCKTSAGKGGLLSSWFGDGLPADPQADRQHSAGKI